jgi:protein SCO1/2
MARRLMRLEYVLALLLMISALILAYQTLKPEQSLHSKAPFSQLPLGGDFAYLSEQGPRQLSDLKGQWVLLYFGYTACPDVCPTSMGMMSALLNALTPIERTRVTGLFISVDPERDTPQQLAQYSQFFHPKILSGTGSKQQIDRAVALYGAAYVRVELDSALGYAMDHTSFIYLIDPQGALRQLFIHGTSPEQMLASLRNHADFTQP